MKVKLIAITEYFGGSLEDLIVHAGVACHGKDYSPAASTGTAYRKGGLAYKYNKEEFIKERLREGHESIVEHASATFDISGISRACSHQLVRHRLASYSQESQRYVDMSNAEFVIPPSIKEDIGARLVLEIFLQDAKEAYQALRQLGIPKEDARFVLPNAIATRIVMTMNFREYRYFIKVRMDKAAQWEIRQLATEILKVLYNQCPSVFEDLYEEFIQAC